jgi:hypothetical protein
MILLLLLRGTERSDSSSCVKSQHLDQPELQMMNSCCKFTHVFFQHSSPGTVGSGSTNNLQERVAPDSHNVLGIDDLGRPPSWRDV